jgi:hypothetical protein
VSYIVSDSSMVSQFDSMYEAARPIESVSGLMVGVVTSKTNALDEDHMMYVVECQVDGKQLPIACKVLSRFGGVYNYEEYNLRPWNALDVSDLPNPIAADSLEYRNGDVVVVGILGVDGRSGIILGGLKHYAREHKIPRDDIQYYSIFQGLETQIRDDGSYKVTFKGKPINEKLLELPPIPTKAIDPIYNPIISGSYYGFDASGSFIATDASTLGPQMIKIFKDVASGSIILKSGQSVVEIGGNPALGQFGAKANTITLDALQAVNIGSKLNMNLQGTLLSIKGLQIAIGNDTVELVNALVELITELGQVIVNSPVGTCTPIATSPNWAAKVIPLQVKLMTLMSSPQDAEAFELKGDDSEDLGDDIEP